MSVEVLTDKLEALEGYVRLLEDYADRDLEQLRDDPTLRGAVERYLHLALETCLDIGEHVIALEGARKPSTYREVVEILGEIGVLDPAFAEHFAGAAGLRNVLVHRYAEVDVARLHAFLQKDLGDFEEFLEAVARYAKQRAD